MTELDKWRVERNEALVNLDIAWARKKVPQETSDAVVLAALHKARVECTDLPPEQRIASAEWLRHRGLRRLGGLEIPPPEVLPE